MTWYVVAECEWLGPNFGQSEYLHMDGYPAGTMGDQHIQTDGATGDPFLAYGISTPDSIPGSFTYGLARMEIGLLASNRIVITSTDITLPNFDPTGKTDYSIATKKYVDDIGGNGGGLAFKTITGITNDVIADQIDDTLTLSSANNRLTIVGNSGTDTITFTLVEGNIDHNSLSGLNAGDNYEHITQAQKTALHNIYTLEQHDNAYHSTNYEPEFSKNDAFNKDWGTTSGTVCQGNDSRLHTIYTLEVHNNTHHNPNYANELIEIIAGTGLTGGGTLQANRTINCSITQYTDGLARSACISALEYGALWNGIHDIGASKHALYTKINAMDTLIAANTTQTEVETIIIAELVNGQSIDVWIDALIATHHHANSTDHDDRYYTEGEVNALVGAKCTTAEAHAYVEANALTMENSINMGAFLVRGMGTPQLDFDAATKKYTDDHNWLEADITDLDKYTQAQVNAKVSDLIYGVGWNGTTTIAPSKNRVYDKIDAIDTTIVGLINNLEYGALWNGVTDVAPSKNAVYDKIVLMLADIAANTTPAEAVTAVATADDYLKNSEDDTTIGSLTVANLITDGDVDGVDVSDLKDAFDALDYYTQAQVDAKTWLEEDITDLDHDAVKILTKEFTEGGGDLVDADIMVYRTATGKWELETKPAAGSTPNLDEVCEIGATTDVATTFSTSVSTPLITTPATTTLIIRANGTYNNIEFQTAGGKRWEISWQGHLYPGAGNTYDIGNASYDVKKLYYCNMEDTSCADFSHLNIDELYNLFAQIKPRTDNVRHINDGKVFNHIDFATLPDDLAGKAKEDFIKTNVPKLVNDKIEMGTLEYKKGDNCGIDMGAYIYALKDLVLELCKKVEKLEKRL